jgi:uncharacterized protein (UPF0332 family)
MHNLNVRVQKQSSKIRNLLVLQFHPALLLLLDYLGDPKQHRAMIIMIETTGTAQNKVRFVQLVPITDTKLTRSPGLP